MKIIEDDLSGSKVLALLNEHLAGMARHSPPDCIHALAPAELQQPEITFWSAWRNEKILGCGALKELNPVQGEIKSMRTAECSLGQGVASAILDHIISVARSRSYTRLSLETGSGAIFRPAHSLYQKYGFEFCGPFADYQEDPFNRFMTLSL
jgi:putative acetyltransferase